MDENKLQIVCANFAQTADDGKTYQYKFYSLSSITAAIAKVFAESKFEQYRVVHR
ncbi:MAG: hypothetical protein Q4B75_07655 [Eubacteriales bacterium]|nr:hypothetical protein [Eubacteriales bacterium]